jgi:hypothetical protein
MSSRSANAIPQNERTVDGLEQILLSRFARPPNDFRGLSVSPVLVALLGLEMKLHPSAHTSRINKTVALSEF